MHIGNIDVVTPEDNPVQFDPAWRSRIAVVLAEDKDVEVAREYEHYKDDKWVKKYAEYIKTVNGKRKPTKEHNIIRLASLWNQGARPSDVKFKLEPLLLTPASFDTIALDVGGGAVDESVFKAYERLFFNIRTDDTRLHRSCHLRTYFATPDGPPGPTTPPETIWRSVGATLGYDALANMWLWSDAHGLSDRGQDYILQELWRVAQSMVFMDLFSRRMNHMDLGMIMDKITNHERMRHETQQKRGEGSESLIAMLGLLAASKPEMLKAATDVDTMADETKRIQAHIASQTNMLKQPIRDLGAEYGEESLNALIATEFKKKTETEQ